MRTWILPLAIVSLPWCAGAAGEPPESRQAAEILKATGVRGGLIVHLGCGDGNLTAALRASASYLVQGLDTDPAAVGKAREHIRSLGLYGPVTADRWDGTRLPYVDNSVNLLVASGKGEAAEDELLRVLAPNGVAYLREGDAWKKIVKPRPKEMDDWTHYLYDASGNAVSHDTLVGPPRRLQWTGSPRWSRHHDRMASMSCMVSANGRFFYIMDHGPIASVNLPPVWELVARDAFNGVVLWRRPIPRWNTHLWPLKSGPGQIPRRLVAVGERVFVTLSLDAPCSALDAATGETVRDYPESKNCEEIIASDGTLFLLASDKPSRWADFRPKATYVWDNTGRANREWAWDEEPRRIVALEAESGKLLWQKDSRVAPLTLAADKEHVAFHDGEKVVCLDRRSGQPLWASDPVRRRPSLAVSFGPTLVLHQDVVLFSGGDRSMTALAAKDGRKLWTAPHPASGHASPEDLLVVGGLVWAGAIAQGGDSGVFTGRDLHTGEVKSEFPPDLKTYWFHHRCYRAKATDNFLIPSRTGIEFVDFRAKHWDINHWVRSGCIYGMLPCNGLVYASPQSCGCYLESKLYGFTALAPGPRVKSPESKLEEEGRLERGPAYEAVGGRPSAASREDDWPTYRHDPARSGATKAAVPGELKQAWAAEIGGKLSSVVVAEGKLFVASVDAHSIHALDAATGKAAWAFTAGGRVDSPPTVWQGRVLFGCADGWVYCLRAADGALAWRFRAAPQDLRIGAFEQLESVWPVSGSVLVQNGVASFVAGRSMFLDGGLRLFRLDAATGRKLSEAVLDDRDPESGENLQVHVKGLDMPVALPDVLSSDGRFLYMRSQRFDLEGKRLEIPPPRHRPDGRRRPPVLLHRLPRRHVVPPRLLALRPQLHVGLGRLVPRRPLRPLWPHPGRGRRGGLRLRPQARVPGERRRAGVPPLRRQQGSRRCRDEARLGRDGAHRRHLAPAQRQRGRLEVAQPLPRRRADRAGHEMGAQPALRDRSRDGAGRQHAFRGRPARCGGRAAGDSVARREGRARGPRPPGRRPRGQARRAPVGRLGGGWQAHRALQARLGARPRRHGRDGRQALHGDD